MSAQQRLKFNEKIKTLQHVKRQNSLVFDQFKVDQIIKRLLNFNELPEKTKDDYNWKSAYEVFQVDSESVLRKRGTEKQIAGTESLFDVLKNAHTITLHGGRDGMYRRLCPTFFNVTRELIVMYTDLCEECQLKKIRKRKSIVTNPILTTELNSPCQVDLIDLQSQPDGPYKYILHYQDHLTKFVRLRPMKSKTAIETAHTILDIFCEMGAPSILQSDNGREFSNEIIKELAKMWPQCKIVHGKPRHSQSQGSVERANLDVQNKLACWLKDNKTTHWTEGLKFVQFSKNASYHRGIGRTPYEAMYGCPPKLGINSTKLPSFLIQKLQTKEELTELLENGHEEAEKEEDDEILLNDVDQNVEIHTVDDGDDSNNVNRVSPMYYL